MGCGNTKSHHRVLEGKFRPIPDRFTTIEQVQQAVREAGLESSNLILGVDFTKSNNWTGKLSYGGRSLHDVSGQPNPYEQVISVIGRTMEEFDDDRLIPAFGFGDSTTGDSSCFPFHEDGRPSVGVEETLQRYREVAQIVNLAGPTSFAPVIREAINIVREEQSYHILVIIADGQVTDPSPSGETARAIIEASQYPLSIIMVGVGDGPWQVMEQYDDELPARRFDNFQFVEFTRLCRQSRGAKDRPIEAIEARFALAALMEIPDQYSYIKGAGLLDPASFPRLVNHSSTAACPRRSPVAPATPIMTATPIGMPSGGEQAMTSPRRPPHMTHKANPMQSTALNCMPPPSYQPNYTVAVAPAAEW